jgi:hypothetical protein
MRENGGCFLVLAERPKCVRNYQQPRAAHSRYLSTSGFRKSNLAGSRHLADMPLVSDCFGRITLELNRKRPGRIRRCEGLVSGRAGSD